MALELPPDEGDDCPFCRAIAEAQFVVASSPASLCVVPEKAQVEGALLVVARRHAPTFLALTPAESLDLLDLGSRSARALVASFELEAFNFWWDTGVLSGQQHLHVAIEILPRREGQAHEFIRLDDRPVLPPERRHAIAARLRVQMDVMTLQGEGA